MTLSVDVWPGSDVPRAVESGYRPVVQVNPDSSGDGRAYLLTQDSDYPELVPPHGLVVRMDSESGSLAVLGQEWAGLRWIGCNSDVYALSPELEVRERFELGSPFVGFRPHGPTEQLILVAEIGMMALSRDGKLNWIVATDIISSITWSDQTASVTQLDESRLAVGLLSGAVTVDQEEPESTI
jgi:hypothetical protein